MLWHPTLPMRQRSNHRKIGRTLHLTAGVTSGLMGNVVLAIQSGVWVTICLPHSVLTQTLHMRVLGVCALLCVCVCRYKLCMCFSPPLSYSLNQLHFWWQRTSSLTLYDPPLPHWMSLHLARWFKEYLRGREELLMYTQRIHYCNIDTHILSHHLKAETVYCVSTWQHVYVFQATITGDIGIPVSLLLPLCILLTHSSLSPSLFYFSLLLSVSLSNTVSFPSGQIGRLSQRRSVLNDDAFGSPTSSITARRFNLRWSGRLGGSVIMCHCSEETLD